MAQVCFVDALAASISDLGWASLAATISTSPPPNGPWLLFIRVQHLQPKQDTTFPSSLVGAQKGHADNQIGCVRIISLDGHQFAEQLEALDDLEHIQ